MIQSVRIRAVRTADLRIADCSYGKQIVMIRNSSDGSLNCYNYSDYGLIQISNNYDEFSSDEL